MKYINKKTGAIIDSNSKLAGNWEVYEPSNYPVKEIEVQEQKEEIIEKPVEEVKIEEKTIVNDGSFDNVTVTDIKKELDAFGIEYNPRAKKQELWDLMLESR